MTCNPRYFFFFGGGHLTSTILLFFDLMVPVTLDERWIETVSVDNHRQLAALALVSDCSFSSPSLMNTRDTPFNNVRFFN